MQSNEALRILAPLTETQRGMVTTAQAEPLGVSRLVLSRLVTTNDLERVVRGVYRRAGSAQLAHDDLYARWLALDPKRSASDRLLDTRTVVAVSHRSAAAIYGIGDLHAHQHTFTSNHRKHTELPGTRVLLDSSLTRSDTRVDSGMTVTSPERTIFDLMRTEGDTSQVADVVGDAVRQRLTNPGALNQAASGWSGRDMGMDIEKLLELVGMGPGSPWRQLDRNDWEAPNVTAITRSQGR